MKKLIVTYTGKVFYPLEPRPQDVCIEDIAHHLSLKARWSGATREHCNVAYHSVLVAHDVQRTLLTLSEFLTKPRHQGKHFEIKEKSACVIAALMHDCGEAYLPDIARDIKEQTYFLTPWGVERFDVVEKRLCSVIFDALNLPRNLIYNHLIKRSDNRALVTERIEQINMPDIPLTLTEPLPGIPDFKPLGQKESEHLFLKEYRRLYHAINS